MVTAAGEEIASTATITTFETVGGTSFAATVGGYARVAGYAISAAKIVNSCRTGSPPSARARSPS